MPLRKTRQTEQTIQRIGKLFFGKEVGIPKTITGTKTFLERGWARKNRQGKLVLTDKGIKSLSRRALIKYPVKKFPLGSDHFSYHALTYRNIFYVLKKKLGSFEGKRILELGFGETDFLEELSKRGAIVSGLDSRRFAEVKGLDLVKGNVRELQDCFKGKKFDAIFSSALFEPGSGLWKFDEGVDPSSRNRGKFDEGVDPSSRNRGKFDEGVDPSSRDRIITHILREANDKLEKSGYLIIETMRHSYITGGNLKRCGFEVVQKEKRLFGNIGFMTIARKK